jgi:FkbM family methyltransferase
MVRILKKIYKKLKRINQWQPKLSPIDNLIRIGTAYGSWVIHEKLLDNTSVCYLAGAGEDISFDVGLAEKYNSQIFIFDPTPRAKKHFDRLIEATGKNEKMLIHKNHSDYYDLKTANIGLLHFREIGLWSKEDEIKFYTPKNPEHVSHSALNLQKTDEYFVAKVYRLSEVMKMEGHREIDLLKIDIEGAEYAVIDSIVEDKLKVKMLCVEYDESYNPLDNDYHKRIRASIEKLIDYGYVVIDSDLQHNYTFVLKETYQELLKYNKK